MNERELFLSALEIEDPEAQQAHLRSACAGEPAILARIQSLLASHKGETQFLNTPVVEQIADDSAGGAAATALPADNLTHDEESDARNFASNLYRPTPQDRNDISDEIPLGYLQPSSRPDSIGRLAHYEVLEVLGRGAFGTVLKAFDEKLHRVVAIKVLAPELAATSPARKRFSREARASAKVRHENVVSIYAVEDAPTSYLVMEYIPGETLQKRLEDHGPLNLLDVLRLGKQIADGLAAAHAQELIHRDVKPGNILLDANLEDHAKITDFGLARTADDASMTQSGMIAGTPLYMAPEQALGHKLDQRADLFSFGSVLYQMLSGRPPFRAPNTIAVLRRVVDDQPRPIPEIIPEVPDWMCQLIGHLHAKNPDDRYGSAKEVGSLLAACLADVEQGRLPNIPAPCRAAQEPDTPAEQISVAPKYRPRAAKRAFRWSLFRIAALVLVVLFAGLAITEATGVSHLATTIIRLSTGSGTLVIESDDPGIRIAIDGEEVTIRGGVEEVTLRPGKYKVAAFKDGKPVRQELVLISRNGRTVVRMSLEPTAPSVWTGWPADAPSPAIAPFDADEAKRHQQAWADYLGVPVEKEIVLGRGKDGNDVALTMVLIPPGEFLMGSSDQEQNRTLAANDKYPEVRIRTEGPQHGVRITRPFWLSKHEATISQFRQFVEATQYKTEAERDGKGGFGIGYNQAPHFVWNSDIGFSQTSDHPVVNVTWNDSVAFCEWLSQQQNGWSFGLPTEAQWEYACRAGTKTPYWSGDEDKDLASAAWCVSNSEGRTHPVGARPKNPFGLYDMHGNVHEWCADWYGGSYYQNSPSDDPQGPSTGSVHRILRGGAVISTPGATRSAFRYWYRPETRHFHLGFRLRATIGGVANHILERPSDENVHSEKAWSYQWPADAPPPTIAPFDAEQAKAHQEAWAKNLGHFGDNADKLPEYG